jgi:hypothetical protein
MTTNGTIDDFGDRLELPRDAQQRRNVDTGSV